MTRLLVGVLLDEADVGLVDRLRGEVPRSTFLREIIRRWAEDQVDATDLFWPRSKAASPASARPSTEAKS